MESSDLPTSDITQATQQSLESLGVRDAATLGNLFDQLERQLGDEIGQLEQDSSATWVSVDALRVRWLGRKQGIVRAITDNWLRQGPAELKPIVGERVNALRNAAETRISAMEAASKAVVRQEGPVMYVTPAPAVARTGVSGPNVVLTPREALDITLPGTRRAIGVRHPLRRVMDELIEIFFAIGYSVKEGPEIESTYYNFEALNIPEDHPSRDDQDTFYIDSKTVLRTHTSPVQIRTMEKQQPPVRIIVPGKVYRHDAPDATHSPIFHQLEGLAVDTNITFADLKGTLDYFLKAFFGPEVRTRLRPSFFPFTEPSAEVDMSCLF